MIKQDNRPQQDSFRNKIGILNELLNDNAACEQKTSAETSPDLQETEKITFISVTGNNNIITTEKSLCTTRPSGKKIPFVAGAVLFLLFF